MPSLVRKEKLELLQRLRQEREEDRQRRFSFPKQKCRRNCSFKSLQHFMLYPFSSVQSLRHVQLFVTPWTAACQTSLPVTKSQSLLKLMSIASMMLSNHLILWPPLLFPASIFPSIRIFSSESVLCIRWPKYWCFRLLNFEEKFSLLLKKVGKIN